MHRTPEERAPSPLETDPLWDIVRPSPVVRDGREIVEPYRLLARFSPASDRGDAVRYLTLRAREVLQDGEGGKKYEYFLTFHYADGSSAEEPVAWPFGSRGAGGTYSVRLGTVFSGGDSFLIESDGTKFRHGGTDIFRDPPERYQDGSTKLLFEDWYVLVERDGTNFSYRSEDGTNHSLFRSIDRNEDGSTVFEVPGGDMLDSRRSCIREADGKTFSFDGRTFFRSAYREEDGFTLLELSLDHLPPGGEEDTGGWEERYVLVDPRGEPVRFGGRMIFGMIIRFGEWTWTEFPLGEDKKETWLFGSDGSRAFPDETIQNVRLPFVRFRGKSLFVIDTANGSRLFDLDGTELFPSDFAVSDEEADHLRGHRFSAIDGGGPSLSLSVDTGGESGFGARTCLLTEDEENPFEIDGRRWFRSLRHRATDDSIAYRLDDDSEPVLHHPLAAYETASSRMGRFKAALNRIFEPKNPPESA